ncbi:imidazole glycerol phosphate synthase subunit HisH, partial [Bacteroides ovatus]
AATTDYIHPFSAALHKDNFYATQFHPEKSGKTGEKILTNFLNL